MEMYHPPGRLPRRSKRNITGALEDVLDLSPRDKDSLNCIQFVECAILSLQSDKMVDWKLIEEILVVMSVVVLASIYLSTHHRRTTFPE